MTLFLGMREISPICSSGQRSIVLVISYKFRLVSTVG